MDEREINNLIDKAVSRTIKSLNKSGFLVINGAIEKTESLLNSYNGLQQMGDKKSLETIARIESAFTVIRKDQYFRIIPLYYIKKLRTTDIADELETEKSTISRNRRRLIRQLAGLLFPGEN